MIIYLNSANLTIDLSAFSTSFASLNVLVLSIFRDATDKTENVKGKGKGKEKKTSTSDAREN